MILRGIKNRLFFQFWLLFFIAMTLVDVLVLLIFLECEISQIINDKRESLAAVCERKNTLEVDSNFNKIQKNENAADLLGNQFVFIKKHSPNLPFAKEKTNQGNIESYVIQSLKDGKPIIKKQKLILGLLFVQYETVIITCPVNINGRVVAAGGIEINLNQKYAIYNRIQRVVLVFISIVSFFFALIGNQQLLRLYYRPLKRLATLAETFSEEENLLYFTVRKEDNEFSVLSSSLNKMLHRISEDKNVLKETIGSLRKANKELVKAQNDVIRAEKMATVGRLTSGIAHEIGNPIGIVLGYLDLLKKVDIGEDDRVDFIQRSEKEISRINLIIRQLLDMSRQSPQQKKEVSIHQLLNDLVSVFNYQPTASHIKFHVAFDALKDIVIADPDQLRQVFLNILINAVDEINMNCSGDAWIKIKTEQVRRQNNMSEMQTKDELIVTIEDNGAGIDPTHLPHLFDPFYTTKEPGKGTGLGLSVCFMIVERLGGYISVDQQPKAGAAFQVSLPLST